MSTGEPAVDPTPQFDGFIPSAICSLAARPLVMTGYLRDILGRHFSSPRNIEEPDLRHLIWRDTDQTHILVESIHRWHPALTELRPGVILRRNAYQNRRIAIGDRHQPTLADRGNPTFATLWLGSHTLFCIGASGAQADLLASEVERELTQFSSLIQSEMRLHRFQVTEVGAVSELEESAEHFVVPLTVGYAFQEVWMLRQQVPVLKRVSLSLILEA